MKCLYLEKKIQKYHCTSPLPLRHKKQTDKQTKTCYGQISEKKITVLLGNRKVVVSVTSGCSNACLRLLFVLSFAWKWTAKQAIILQLPRLTLIHWKREIIYALKGVDRPSLPHLEIRR